MLFFINSGVIKFGHIHCENTRNIKKFSHYPSGSPHQGPELIIFKFFLFEHLKIFKNTKRLKNTSKLYWLTVHHSFYRDISSLALAFFYSAVIKSSKRREFTFFRKVPGAEFMRD